MARWCRIFTTLTVLLTACGSVSHNTVRSGATDSQWIEVQDLSIGYAANVVPAADNFFVFGGIVLDPGGKTQAPSPASGVIRSTGGFDKIGAGPFTLPLLGSGAVWTGTDLVVVGTPCGKTSTSEDAMTCDGAELEAARVDLSGQWTSLTLPKGLSGSSRLDPPQVKNVSGLGLSGSDAFFTVGNELWSMNAKTDEWTHLSWVPELSEGASYVPCVVSGGLMVATRSQSGLVPSETNVTQVWRYQAETATWDRMPTPPQAKGIEGSATLSCENGLLSLSETSPITGVAIQFYDSTSTSWITAPDLVLTSSRTPARIIRYQDALLAYWGTSENTTNAAVLLTGAAQWLPVQLGVAGSSFDIRLSTAGTTIASIKDRPAPPQVWVFSGKPSALPQN